MSLVYSKEVNTDCKTILKSTIGFSLLDSTLFKTYLYFERKLSQLVIGFVSMK